MNVILIAGLAGLLNLYPPVGLIEPPSERLADGCELIEVGQAPAVFTPHSLHTTMLSTFHERSLRDFEPGAEQETGREWRDRVGTLPIPPMRERIVRPHRPHQRVFCRFFDASAQDVRAAAAGLVASLGYPPPDPGSEGDPELSTGFRDERGRTEVWMDRYRITIDEQADGTVVGRVTRQVFVSRSAGLYIQGISDGRNEHWMLERLARLASSG